MMRLPERLGLWAKLLVMQIAIVLLVVVLMFGTFVAILSRSVEAEYSQLVLGIAHAVAITPDIRDAFDDPNPSSIIQPIAEAIRQKAGLAFVVVANRDKVRYSHPNPEQIGQPVSTDPGSALDGEPYVAIERGTLGDSIRAKVPILGRSGEIVGFVSAGILLDFVQLLLGHYWVEVLGVALFALIVGVVSAYLVADHVKRQIFGLEPREIAALLEQREAMLQGIREGVVAVDQRGVITLVNDEAVRLLDLPSDAVGRLVSGVMPNARLQEVLTSGQAERDRVMVANGRVILVSRIPVQSRGQLVGAISTFRDQTEMQELVRELDGTRSHLDSLRAQAHEFANKLHTIAGLVELGWKDEALAFIYQATRQQQNLVERLPKQIADPALVALLVGKASVAGERGITLRVRVQGKLRPVLAASTDLATIVGNLIENAFDAVGGRPERIVQVSLKQRDEQITIEVSDSGPGVPADIRDLIFEEGFSTKPDPRRQRGVGLALVRRAAQRLGGDVAVRNRNGAVFTATLPCGLAGDGSPESEALVV